MHRFIQALFISLSVLLLPSMGSAAVVQVGNITGVTVTTNAQGNMTLAFAVSTGGNVNITPYAPDVVRVDFHWAGDFPTEEIMIDKPLDQWSSAGTTWSDQGSHYLIQTSELDIEVEKTPYKVHFKDKSGFYLLQHDFTEYDDAYNYTGQSGNTTSKLKTRKIVPNNQAFFGLGEFGGPMNRRGYDLECWNTGTYNWGEFTNPTYLNIPFFYGVQPADGGNPAYVYGLFFHNQCRPKFKFGTEQNDRYSFQAGDGRMDYFFFGGGSSHTFAKVIDRYSELTGRPTMLPKWGLGHHLSRFSYANQPWVEYIANESTNQDIPLDAVYLDIDYMEAGADGNPLDGDIRQLTFNANFPNPAGMVSYCHARGVKVVPLIEPWLLPGDPLHTEADANFHFIKDNGGNTIVRGIYVGNVSWFDYTSTAMNDWWSAKITNWFASVPMDGIWNDLTEPEGGDQIPHDALHWQDGKYGNNADSRRHFSNERNYFGIRASQQSYNAMLQRDPNKRPFILGRSGNAGLQRYAVSWSGDTAANFFYHEKTIRFGMGAMIAGVAWYGNDVGGFAGTPSGELMVRSTEANFLTPFFRNHGDKASADREPWRFNATELAQQRHLIKLRYRMMPYLYTLAYEATITGEPMNVPAVFDYYEDTNTHSLNDYEYLVGDYVFCAPVLGGGQSSRSVYLPYAPDVDWYYWPSGNANGQVFAGGQTVNVSAPQGDCPLFIRSGAIMPMGPSMQYANEFQPDWMDINCWPKGYSEFTLHEDDGETWDYLSGEYAKTRFISNRTDTDWDFTIEARTGTYNPGTRDFYVYCFNPGTNIVQSVSKNGSPLPEVSDFETVSEGWMITGDGRIGIKVPDDGTQKALNVNFGDAVDAVQHQWPTYTVPEDGNIARIFVTRTGDATGTVSVAYNTADIPAGAGVDYIATNGTLTWLAGDTSTQFFDVAIIDDGAYRGDRSFNAILSNPVGANLGLSTSVVTITDDEPVPPAVAITNPATDITLSTTTTHYTVQGIANAAEWDGISWSNDATGASGSIPVDYLWEVLDIALNNGTNLITICVTNPPAVGASDSASDPAYSAGWSNGDNGGSGWSGGWTLIENGTSGHFKSGPANSNSDAGDPAFGMWANNSGLSEAIRSFASPMVVGQTFSFRFDNNFIDNGSSIGFGLQNAAGDNLLEFYFNGGDANYTLSDNTPSRDSGLPWTGSGLDIEVELTSPTTYELSAGGVTNTGTLASQADQNIARFRTWNFNAGNGSDYDYFFNDLSLTPPPGAGVSTCVTVRIILADSSLIPQSWRDRHGLTGPDSGDLDNKDGDHLNNYDEYIADTDPNDTNSVFGTVIAHAPTNGSGAAVTVEIMPPTTNSRVYGVSYSTNLNSGVWTDMGTEVPGPNDGGGIMITVTNDTDDRLYYRGHVDLSAAIGASAELITRFHDVSGTVTLLNGNTIEVSNFTYDGDGIDTRAVFSPNSSYSPYTSISDNLLNPSGYTNDTLTFTLPEGTDLNDVRYFSIWCVPVGVSFGDCLLQSP